MGIRALAIVAAVLGGTGGEALAGGFTVVSAAEPPAVATAPGRTPMEWVRIVGPWVGHDVVVPTSDGRALRTIEWRSRNEVRARTESGAPLSLAEREAVRALALTCQRGEVRDPSERFEWTGTYVVEFDCARLQ